MSDDNMKIEQNHPDLEELRHKAEEAIRDRTRPLRKILSQDEQVLVHDLETYQVELEMQNEELRRAQQELEASRRRYSDLFDFAPVGYFVLDRHGIIRSVNTTGARLLKYEGKNLAGLPFSNFVTKDDWPQFYAHLQEAFVRQVPLTLELRMLRPDQSVLSVQLQSIIAAGDPQKPALCRTAMIDRSEYNEAEQELQIINAELQRRIAELSDANSEVVASRRAALNLIEDALASREKADREIAERSRVEEALRESEARFRTMADESPFMIWVTDVDGRIQFVNRSYAEFFGVTAKDVREEGWQPLVHPDDSTMYTESFVEALRSRKPFRAQARVRRYDGQWRWVDSYGSPRFSPSGEFLGMVGSSPDITDQKRAEQGLRKAMERARILAETASELLQTTDPQGVVQRLCDAVMQYLDCHVFFNYLMDPSTGGLRLNAYAGIPEDEAGRIKSLKLGVAVCGCVAQLGQRIIAEHIPTTNDSRTDLVKSYGVKAYACHPLLGVGGKIIGTLSFGTKNREIFTDEEIEMMKTVTDYVAVAMARIQGEEALRRAHDELEKRVSERTEELTNANKQLTKEIEERTRIERSLRETSELLRAEQEALRKKNITLHEVLGQIQSERDALKRQLTLNFEQAVMPSLQRLKLVGHPEVSRLTGLLEHDLKEIVSPFLTALKQRHVNLTPREMEICRFIKNGLSTKEIADTLSVSPMTVQKHRELIRRKLGLNNEDINLQTYLQQVVGGLEPEPRPTAQQQPDSSGRNESDVK